MPTVKTNKEEIIVEALNIFRKKGYYNTSMSDLALECGLQKGSFYYYFNSKEELMVEVLSSVKSYLKNKVFSIAFYETLSPKERMESMLMKLGNSLLKQEGGCIVGNTILETSGQSVAFKPVLKEIIEDWTMAMKHIFQTKYSENTSQRMAEQAVMEFEGAVMLSRLYETDKYLKDVFVKTMAKLL